MGQMADNSTRRLVWQVGTEVMSEPDWACCGAPARAERAEARLAAAEKVVEAAEANHVQQVGQDHITYYRTVAKGVCTLCDALAAYVAAKGGGDE
jgi:hypothetical protein